MDMVLVANNVSVAVLGFSNELLLRTEKYFLR